MRLCKASLAMVIVWCAGLAVCAQETGKAPEQRAVLEQILVQTYQPALVGKGLMGMGAEADVRRAGTIVVVQRGGLWGSITRNQVASFSIHGLKAELYRGHQDYAVPVGERFYVIGVHVGEYTVDIAMLSARPVNAGQTTARVWTTATFYFTPEIVANTDKSAVLREIDQWFIPEGRTGAVAAPIAASAAPSTPAAANSIETLRAGMSREEVLAGLGKPQREVIFETQTWMQYPGMVVLLKDGKLASVEGASPATARVTLRSEPDAAEIYVDGELAGSTPSTLQVSAGKHQIRMRLTGHPEWVREVQILAASDVQFNAKLDVN